jgi:glycine cleavage system H protein
MDAFTYNNIFETKGIEYIVILVFFAILIPFWLILNKKLRIPGKIRRLPAILTAGILRIPQGLFFCKNHTWAHLSRNGVAEIGLDDLLLHITGEVNLITIRENGERISRGDIIARIEQNGKTLTVLSPVSGVVMNSNHALTEHPALLAEDPYKEGWIYKVKPSAWKAETSSYLLAEDAVAWLGNELSRFRDFLMASASEYTHRTPELILQDGGELKDHTLSEMPDAIWSSFQEEFMMLDGKSQGGRLSD